MDFKGIYAANGKYNARIAANKKAVHLGAFDTETEAAEAYDVAALILGRPLNSYNFPERVITVSAAHATTMLLYRKGAIDAPDVAEFNMLQLKAITLLLEVAKTLGGSDVVDVAQDVLQA